MGFFIVLRAELMRTFIIMRRYWFASVLSIIMGYGTLMVMIYGFMMSRDQFAETAAVIAERASSATGAAVGFLLGIWAFGLVGIFTQGLQGMARTGELEQVCMSPYGLVTNFLVRSFVIGFNSMLSLGVMVYLVAITVEGKLHYHPIALPVIVFLTYANLIGFGFMVGGLVLIFKQVGQIAIILRFLIVALALFGTMKDITQWPGFLQIIVHCLPITDAAICMRGVIIDGIGADVFRHESFYFLIVSCIVWTSIGIYLFRIMENMSRDKGTLGSY